MYYEYNKQKKGMIAKMKIKYNNTNINAKNGITIQELLASEIKEKNAVAAKYNNEIKSLNYKLENDGTIELLDISSKDGIRAYRKGLLFIIDKAITELYPNAKMIVNFQLSNSLLCEFDNLEITDEVIEKVNKRVKEIVELDLPIVKQYMTKEEAAKFYEENDTTKGRLQLELKNKKEVSLYWCEDYFNYFYGIMPTHTGIMNIYEIIKYHRGILIRYPNKKDITKLAEFKEHKKLLSTLDEYDLLHRVLEVPTVRELNEKIRKGQIREYILLDEALHEKKIANIADDILNRKKTKMILIAGPSSSGKTTFAQRLGIQLRLNGLKPVTISVDNYFVERKDNPKDENGEYDFECIEAIDTKLFNDHLVRLLRGEEVEVPKFDFEVGTKKYNGKKIKLAEDEVLVIEGIHCLNDKLTELIPKEQKYKIYISCLTVLNMNEKNRISKTDYRLIRRMVRDKRFR